MVDQIRIESLKKVKKIGFNMFGRLMNVKKKAKVDFV